TCVAGTGNGTSTAIMNGGGYFSNSAYLTVNGGHPVTGTFISESSFFTSCSGCSVYNDGTAGVTCTGSSDCWTKIWAGVSHHISGWATAPVFYWRNSFTHTSIGSSANNGSYRWINPNGDRTNWDKAGYDTWLCSGVACGTASAVGTTKPVMTAGYAKNDHAQSSFQNDNLGFEGYCGQTWVNSLSEPNSNASWFAPGNDIQLVQLITWNDQEQGTMIENGIPTCYGISASLSGSTVNYSITTTDTTFAPIPLNMS